MPTANDLIAALNLEPLAHEGGYFRRTWLSPSAAGDRPAGNAILYLITPDSFSALHRLDSTEIFHFYMGDPCEQFVIDPNGEVFTAILGSDVMSGQQVQTIVPSDCWQGTKLAEGGEWALVGTTMAPAYSVEGFELATIDDVRHFDADVAAVATSYLADGA